MRQLGYYLLGVVTGGYLVWLAWNGARLDAVEDQIDADYAVIAKANGSKARIAAGFVQ